MKIGFIIFAENFITMKRKIEQSAPVPAKSGDQCYQLKGISLFRHCEERSNPVLPVLPGLLRRASSQ